MRDYQREYGAVIKARDGISPTQKYRPARNLRHPGNCSACGKHMKQTALSAPMCQPCRRRAKRTLYINKANRLALYERDGWTCGICLEPVDAHLSGNDNWAPTLDHIIPRSKGGSDDHTNLRLAHRWCNTARGNLDYATDEDFRAS